MIYVFNLPHPDKKIIFYCEYLAKKTPINFSSIDIMKEATGGDYNITSGAFVSDKILQTLVSNQYSCFFNNLVSSVGIIKNLNNSLPGCYPPHADKSRLITLNYYINLGGSNVKTILYRKFDYQKNLEDKLSTYNSLEKTNEYVLESNIWYCMNTRQYHSVENIETTRIILSISFYEENFYSFIINNKNIITKQL